MDFFSSLPHELQRRAANHLRAAREAFANMPDDELAGFYNPAITDSSRAQITEYAQRPSAKALGLMHLALARAYVSKDGQPPPQEFFNPRELLAIARFLKRYNPDEPRDGRGRWTGDGEIGTTDSSGNDGAGGSSGELRVTVPNPANIDHNPDPSLLGDIESALDEYGPAIAGIGATALLPEIALPAEAVGEIVETEEIAATLQETEEVAADESAEEHATTAALSIPDNPSIVGHIFRNTPGHFAEDTPENRALIEDTANDPQNFIGTSKSGSDVYGQSLPDGQQVWVQSREGVIRNGGINQTPTDLKSLLSKIRK